MNIELICIDCHAPFVIDDGEQKFFAVRGYNLPKRCKACRAHRKKIREQADAARDADR